MTLDFISRLKPDIAFVGAVGVDVKENSVSTYDIDDGINKAAIIRHSKKAYVVAEARKLSTDGNYNYTTLDTLSGSSRIRSRQQTSAQQRIRTAWRSSCHDVLYAAWLFAVYSVSVYLENSIYGHPGRTEVFAFYLAVLSVFRGFSSRGWHRIWELRRAATTSSSHYGAASASRCRRPAR